MMKIAVIVKSVHPYWNEVELGVKEAAKKYNIETIFHMPQKELPQLQIAAIENFISSGYQGIVFATSFPEEIASTIKKIVIQGIPCIAIDTDAPQTERHLYVGTNNYLAGRIAGDTLSQILKGQGKIIISTGSLSATNSVERIKGFREVIERNRQMEIVDILCDDEDANKAYMLAYSTLLKHKDLSAFYGVFSFNGPAAAKAVKVVGKVNQVKIVCFDLIKETVDFLKERVINATLGQRPYMIGYRSIQVMYDILKFGLQEAMKRIPPSRIIDTGVDVINPDNLETHKKFLEKIGIKVSF